MSDKTGIEWTDHTFNPWWGCSRVSPACRFCYADRDAQRYGFDVWRRKGPRRMLSEANWQRPVKWNREAGRAGIPAKVFSASMADVFEDHPQVVEPRKRLWGVIEATPWLWWQLLTKRIENVAGMVPWGDSWPPNVWLGTSVESQRYADERIPVLAGVPARVRFLSCEPLLGPVDLTAWLGSAHRCPGVEMPAGSTEPRAHTVSCCSGPALDWVIAGGESGGSKVRPMHPGWVRKIRDDCSTAGVPFLFKQYGEWGPREGENWPLGDAWRNPGRHCWVNPADGKTKPFGAFTGIDDFDWAPLHRVGKKAAGRVLDGRTWDEFPRAAEAVPA